MSDKIIALFNFLLFNQTIAGLTAYFIRRFGRFRAIYLQTAWSAEEANYRLIGWFIQDGAYVLVIKISGQPLEYSALAKITARIMKRAKSWGNLPIYGSGALYGPIRCNFADGININLPMFQNILHQASQLGDGKLLDVATWPIIVLGELVQCYDVAKVFKRKDVACCQSPFSWPKKLEKGCRLVIVDLLEENLIDQIAIEVPMEATLLLVSSQLPSDETVKLFWQRKIICFWVPGVAGVAYPAHLIGEYIPWTGAVAGATAKIKAEELLVS